MKLSLSLELHSLYPYRKCHCDLNLLCLVLAVFQSQMQPMLEGSVLTSVLLVVVTVDVLVAEVATVDVFVAELTHGTASKGP